MTAKARLLEQGTNVLLVGETFLLGRGWKLIGVEFADVPFFLGEDRASRHGEPEDEKRGF